MFKVSNFSEPFFFLCVCVLFLKVEQSFRSRLCISRNLLGSAPRF